MSTTFPVVVSAVLQRGDAILLLKRAEHLDHAPGLWDPCSGRVERGETPKQAVMREAQEETGLNVEPLRVIDTFRFLRGAAQEECIGITFLCRADEGEIILSEEHTEAQWVKLDNLDQYELAAGLFAVLQSLKT